MKLVSFLLVLSAGALCAQPAMTHEEISRRLIRKQVQIICSLAPDKTYAACDFSSVPTRVTFASLQVNSQGTDNYPVKVRYTVRKYYRDSTYTYDSDDLYTLKKGPFGWEVQSSEGHISGNRYEPKAAPPPPGETDVPSPTAAAAQPVRNIQASAGGAGGTVPLCEYNCVMYAGGQLIHAGGFTLLAGGAYHDEDNGRGTFTYDSNQHQISFRGAAMSGQVGRYDSKGTFTLKSARNSVDCDRGN